MALRGTSRAVLAAPALVIVAVLLEVTVMPYLHIADGAPDLVAPAVVAIGLLRGPFAGAVAGFSAGLLIELAAPIGTLGVYALLYLAVGAVAGRYAGRPEASRPLAAIVMSVAAAGAVEVGYALVQAMLGTTLGAAELVGSVILPTMALTALLAAPVLLVARRVLGTPSEARGAAA
jgi:rod shape-determining protein MreD